MVYDYCTDSYTIAGSISIEPGGLVLREGSGYASIGVADVVINAAGKIEVVFQQQGQVFSAAATLGGRPVRHEGVMVGTTGAVDRLVLYLYDPELDRLLDLNQQSDYDRVVAEGDSIVNFDVKHVKTE